MEEAQKFG